MVTHFIEVYRVGNETKTTSVNSIKYLKEYIDFTKTLFFTNTIAIWHITLKTKKS